MIPKSPYFVIYILLLASLGLVSVYQAGVASHPILQKRIGTHNDRLGPGSDGQINLQIESEQSGETVSSQDQQTQGNPLFTEALPVAPSTYYKYYTGSDFTSRSPTLFEPVYYAPGAIYSSALSGGQSDYLTRLDLPQGARVTEVTYIFIDNTVVNMDFFLVRYDPLERTFTDLIVLTSASASASPRTIINTGSPIFSVDNAYYSYQLQIRTKVASSEHAILGVRVGYTIPTIFAPLVTK